MEHSALHALQLIGLFLALGGPLLVLGVLHPAQRALGPGPERESFAAALESNVARWVFYGALAAALGSFADFFVQAAELEGRTVFSGLDLPLVVRFASQTASGQLGLARAGVLLLAALLVRLAPKRGWWPLLLLSGAAILFTGLVSHAAAQPEGRAAAVTIEVLHLFAGAAWLGILIHLLAARVAQVAKPALSPVSQSAHALHAAGPPTILPPDEPGLKEQEPTASPLKTIPFQPTPPACQSRLVLVAEIVRRFSPVALAVVGLLLTSGVLAAIRFIGEPGALLTSAYGLTLLLKLLLLVVAFYAGLQNYRGIRPALLASAAHPAVSPDAANAQPEQPKSRPLLQQFGRMLELEVTAGLLVLSVAGVLGSVSPPGGPGVQRLTEAQAQALVRPHAPTTSIVNPQTFYGAPERTLDDLRYSEFTHNCSGIAVCLLGLCWLLQSAGGKLQRWGARLWPGLLVLFGIFIGLASDPEVWLLRRVSLWQALADPQLLEHQLGAGMVFLLAWLAWRNRSRPAPKNLLGYALPGIMIFGSLLLLGHAHSTLNTAEHLTNLINVQHAIFGTFGLLAGTIRWLQLRALIPSRIAKWAWPALIIGLGLFMACYYREVV